MIRARTRLALAGVSCLAGWLVLSEVPAATDTPAGWRTQVIDNLRRAEYEYSPVGNGSWSAPNRAHDVRSFISADGLSVIPRRPVAQPWEFDLRLVGFGRRDALADTGAPLRPLAAVGNRVELTRSTLTEWYVNEPEGIEQGFTIPAPPARGTAGQPVVIEMRVSGDVVADLSADGQEVLFRTASGRAALRYDTLLVLDSAGRRLASRFESTGDRLRIVMDDGGAVYPLLVDPLVTDPDWSAESGQALASFGVSVASAGDVNGDGFDDVIVGADDYDNFEADEGQVFVYYGGPSGPALTPSWIIESNHAFSKFGRSVATAGDIDNDGYDDIIIGAPEYDDDPTGLVEKDEGWAFVFFGSATGLPGGPVTTVASADWTAQANQMEAALGRRVASAGDVNNDGYDDVVIGASDYSNDQAFEGAAFLYLGSATGLGAPGVPGNADWRAEGNFVNSLFGHGLASAGDVNGDGRDDVVVGARNFENNYEDEGQVRLYLGTATGVNATPVWTLDGGRNSMRLGVSVDSAGDVNGDGYDDILIGADIYSNGQSGEGAAFVFPGDPNPALLGTTPAWTAEVNQGDAFLGFSVAGAGDVNNDGYDDVIVGAEGFDNGELDEGAAFLYYGSETGLALTPTRSFEINQAGARYGISVETAGDVNNDGYADVIVGADKFTKLLSQEGGAFLYLGCRDDEQDGVCHAVDNCPDLFNPDQVDTDLDGLGDVCDACQDVDIDGVCDQPRVLIESSGPGEQVLIKFGSGMRYLANVATVDPGVVLEWTELTYPDELFPPWAVGAYGVGFETAPVGGAQNLLLTTNPPDPGTISVFTRAQFTITSVADVSTLFLGAEWDDGYIAWINGVEVFRSPQMPTGTPLWNTPPLLGHESSNGVVPNYGKLNDISFTGIPALRDGLNVLAVGVWNIAPGSSDLVLVPRLSINRPKTSTMRYLANSSDPLLGATWTETGFDEVANDWTPGNYGVGFETVAGADDLINTDIPAESLSVFTRARINIDPATVESVFFGADYDDAAAIWINGTEVYRSPEMPGTPGVVPPWNADPSPPHESSNGAVPDYTPLHDITSVAKPEFFQGENVVAVGGWTSSIDTDDMVLVPRLSINEGNIDNCVDVFNPDQSDIDLDGLGDACDPDIDGDGHLNGADNCPLVANDQSDLDVDGIGDACDSCPDDAGNDVDLDGICAGTGYSPPMVGDGDNCPATFNPPEDCDNLPGTPDEQCDLDLDGIGDACDPDIDGDGVDNGLDNCPWVDNPGQGDFDVDTVGDACDCVFDNDQAWEVPSALDSVRMTKIDSCGNYACSESAGVCVGDLDCNYDFCQDYFCSESLGPCASDLDCNSDTCENFQCSVGLNPCVSDVECTADFCDNRTCTAGANPCTSDVDCTADFCDNMQCTLSMNPCFSHFDCSPDPQDLCVGFCSLGANPCVGDSNCTLDVCGDGTCFVDGSPCSDDSTCTGDICQGTCSIGANTCTSDVQCTAAQTDLCEGTCTIGLNTCASDVDCTVPQTDLCLGACTIGGNECSSDAACIAPAIDTLFWLDPAVIGGTSVVFDTLRSPSPSDFTTGTTCVETDGLDRITSDGTIPTSGTVLHYLIRVENECPDGNMGSSSSGPRTGVACE